MAIASARRQTELASTQPPSHFSNIQVFLTNVFFIPYLALRAGTPPVPAAVRPRPGVAPSFGVNHAKRASHSFVWVHRDYGVFTVLQEEGLLIKNAKDTSAMGLGAIFILLVSAVRA